MNLQDILARLDPNWNCTPEQLIGRVFRIQPTPKWFSSPTIGGMARKWAGIKCKAVGWKENDLVDFQDEGPLIQICECGLGSFPGPWSRQLVHITAASLQDSD